MSDKGGAGEGAEFRSGFVLIIGRPNVGKSTFLNALLGEKIAATSVKPQTTRNRIAGVVNRDNRQIVFLDTPGVHDSPKLMNVYLNKEAFKAIDEVEAVLFMVDGSTWPKSGDRLIAKRLATCKVPIVLAINKSDLAKTGGGYTELLKYESVHRVSALEKTGVDELLDHLTSLLPVGPRYYPDDILTDRPERFIVAEFVREKIFAWTGDEIPYSSAVTVDSWDEREGANLVVIHASVHVERDSQKGIILGEGGKKIKRIGRAAREDIERLLGMRVYLDLHVAVEKNWTKDAVQLKRFGIEG